MEISTNKIIIMEEFKMVKQEFDNVKNLVTYVLENYPITRSNDTLLYLECCKVKGCRTIDDIKDINLSIISVHKIRQKIQNKEGLYLPDNPVINNRKNRAEEVKEYMLS